MDHADLRWERMRVQAWLLVAGLVVLVVTVFDALVTTIAPDSGGGAITSRLARGLWYLAERTARRPGGWLLRSIGPVVALLTTAFWLFGLWVGWFLVFSAAPNAVVSDTTGVPADGWTRLYYAGVTFFTLGFGDYVPVGTIWQVATVLASFTGLAFVTLAITFLLPIVTAVTQRRQQANRIYGLGHDAQEIVINCWDGTGFAALEQLLPDLANELLLTAERRLAYPILGYFHASAVADDHRVQLTAIDEAASLLRHGVDRDRVAISPVPLRMIRHAIVQQLERANRPPEPEPHVRPFTLDLEPLRAAGIPTVDDATFDRAIADEAEHRRRLVALVATTRWEGAIAVRTRGDAPDA